MLAGSECQILSTGVTIPIRGARQEMSQLGGEQSSDRAMANVRSQPRARIDPEPQQTVPKDGSGRLLTDDSSTADSRVRRRVGPLKGLTDL